MKKLLAGLAAFAIAASSYAATVENSFGKQEVPDDPKRIVLLDWGSADTLAQLGVADKVVGVAKGEVFPSYIADFYKNTAAAGSLGQPDFEAIAKLNPDLIVVANRAVKHEAALKEIAPVFKVDVDYADSWNSIRTNLLNWGKLTGTEKKAEEQLAAFDKEAGAIKATTDKLQKSGLAVLINERKINAYGPDSRFAIVHQYFNFKPVDSSIKADRHGQQISYEFIQEKNPDFIFVVDRTAAITDVKDNAAKTLDNPLVKGTNAAKSNGIVYLPADVMYLAYGGIEGTKKFLSALKDGVEGSTYYKNMK